MSTHTRPQRGRLAFAALVAALSLLIVAAPATPNAGANDPADVTAQIDQARAEIERQQILPPNWVAIPMWGNVWANGHDIGMVDFALFYDANEPTKAQLWALWREAPTHVCSGDIFKTPQGEPIFFGETSLMAPAGTCHMARLPNHTGISLYAASNDGQWATSILTSPDWHEPAAVFAD